MSNTKQEVCKQLKELDQRISIVEIEYSGSGDSFGDFYNIYVTDADKNEVNVNQGDVQTIVEDYCFEVFDMSGQPDFNNDGSEGTITIDVDNMVTKLDNYRLYMERESTGEEFF